MKRIVMAALALLGTVQPVMGQDRLTARVLYSVCFPDATEPPEAREQADVMCATYFYALTDAMFIMQSLARKSQATCLPNETPVDVKEAKRIFRDWLLSHREAAEFSGGLVAAMAIIGAHNCRR